MQRKDVCPLFCLRCEKLDTQLSKWPSVVTWWSSDSEIGLRHRSGASLCYSRGAGCISRLVSASNDDPDDDADEISRPHLFCSKSEIDIIQMRRNHRQACTLLDSPDGEEKNGPWLFSRRIFLYIKHLSLKLWNEMKHWCGRVFISDVSWTNC